jgi:hypothetical protein
MYCGSTPERQPRYFYAFYTETQTANNPYPFYYSSDNYSDGGTIPYAEISYRFGRIR